MAVWWPSAGTGAHATLRLFLGHSTEMAPGAIPSLPQSISAPLAVGSGCLCLGAQASWPPLCRSTEPTAPAPLSQSPVLPPVLPGGRDLLLPAGVTSHVGVGWGLTGERHW